MAAASEGPRQYGEVGKIPAIAIADQTQGGNLVDGVAFRQPAIAVVQSAEGNVSQDAIGRVDDRFDVMLDEGFL